MSETCKVAMRALEDLTPGGSEYVGDIARCVEFIRQRQASQHQHMISLTKRIRISEDRDKLVRELAGNIKKAAETAASKQDQQEAAFVILTIVLPHLGDKAGELLALYDSSPADTNSHEVRRARGAM